LSLLFVVVVVNIAVVMLNANIEVVESSFFLHNCIPFLS